jgi:peptidoglycan hydrolase-like protein with peptidoglycan-binding domain
MSKAALALIQTGLRDLGYSPGPLDGIYGARTRTAVQAWLDADGAPATVAIAPQTRNIIHQGKARYPVAEIVVHCSATRPDWMGNARLADQVAEIRRWHIEDRGWRTIGYHWVIGRDGSILPGRAETEIGAGVEGHNRGVIHICLIGGAGSAETDSFTRNFTGRQDIALRGLMQGIAMRTGIRRISGHNEWAAKACPGFNVPDWLKEAA